jgi:DNA methyltransferase 1-associated protein 1
MENTGRHTHVAAFLRSTKIAVPKASSAIRTTEILSEMGIGSKLVMPTRSNLDMFEQLVHTVSMLVDMKRQVDRADQEIRVLEAQARGFVPKQ